MNPPIFFSAITFCHSSKHIAMTMLVRSNSVVASHIIHDQLASNLPFPQGTNHVIVDINPRLVGVINITQDMI